MAADTAGTFSGEPRQVGAHHPQSSSEYTADEPDGQVDWTSFDRNLRRCTLLWGCLFVGLLAVYVGLMRLVSLSAAAESWGVPLLFAAIRSILAFLVVGGASFYFRSLSMLAVYATLLIWTALYSLLTFMVIGIIFSYAKMQLGPLVLSILLYVILAWLALRQFMHFRRIAQRLSVGVAPSPAASAESEPEATSSMALRLTVARADRRAAAIFPWAAWAPVEGVPLLFSFVLLAHPQGYEGLVILLLATESLAIVGLAFGLPAFLLRFGRRAVNALAVLISALALTGLELVLLLATIAFAFPF